MTITCPHCNDRLQCDGDCRGQPVQCPSCNHIFTVPTVQRLARAQPEPKPSKNAHFGCFLLGLFFNFVGIIIASLVAGQPGARAALRGFLIELLTAAILYAILTISF